MFPAQSRDQIAGAEKFDRIGAEDQQLIAAGTAQFGVQQVGHGRRVPMWNFNHGKSSIEIVRGLFESLSGGSFMIGLNNNTDIISINQNVLGQLAEGDVRANYFLIGATWANNTVPGNPGAIVKGSLTLANTTMETFFQTQNCFLCHQGQALGDLSHIYGKVKKFEK